MTDTSAPAHVPTEDETLTTGPDEGFSREAFKARVLADKYRDHEVWMAQLLSRHASAGNRRRWAITWRGETVTEDEYTLVACSHAQKYTGIVWGAMAAAPRVDPEWDTEITLGLLYGMARTVFGMDDAEARAAVAEVTGPQVREILTYQDGDERPKAESDQ